MFRDLRGLGHVGMHRRSISWVLFGSSSRNAEVRPVALSEGIMLSPVRKLVLNMRRRHPMARFAELMHRVKRLARLMADVPTEAASVGHHDSKARHKRHGSI